MIIHNCHQQNINLIYILNCKENKITLLNPFQPIVAFHIETNHSISTASQMTGFYMKCNIRLKRVKLLCSKAVCNFTKSNGPPRMFFTFFKLYKGYKIAQSVTYGSMARKEMG